MAESAILKWLSEQWNVSIVNEGGQCRLGLLVPRGALMERKWFAGANIGEAISAARENLG